MRPMDILRFTKEHVERLRTPRLEPCYLRGELLGWRLPDGAFLPVVAGGARDHDIVVIERARLTAVAGTTTEHAVIPGETQGGASAYLAKGFYWQYDSTEANADNTFDFATTHGAAGTGTTIFSNGNANGLLDTGAVGTPFINRRDAASGGAAALAASDPTDVRVPGGDAIQFVLVTAGTGTIPTVRLGLFGHFV